MAHQSNRGQIRMGNCPATRGGWKVLGAILEGGWKVHRAGRFSKRTLRSFFLLFHSKPCQLPALDPCLWQLLRYGLSRYLCPEHAPGAWHDAIEIIAPASYCHPATL